MTEDQKAQIREVFEKLLERRAKKIKSLRFRDLEINPFLVRLISKEMNLTNARSIVEWRLGQHWERGMVTALGSALESIAKVFSEGTGVEGADILKTKGGRRHYIQVKSGPNTVPKDMAQRITQLLQGAQRRNRGSTAIFGMCYGRPDQVSDIIRKYVGVDVIAGKEFWKFISDDPNCIDEIYEIAGEVGASCEVEPGKTLKDLLDGKLLELEQEFVTFYGAGGDSMWKEILRRNS